VSRDESFSYHLSEQPAHEVEGGSVKIVDPLTFPIASMFSAAIVTVKPGAMREIHWHPNSDEWTFFIEGQGRATLFTPPASANTFDFRAGDVGYFPKSNSHYVENTGTTDLIFVEVLQADHFSGMSHFPQLFPFLFSGFLLTRYACRYFPWPVDRLHSQADH
jgi:oxalate decarboxylase family bicupin protein